jgi:adenine-specific DNA-methyltransferase
MAKKNKYADWTKEDLIKQISALEKRKKYGLVWDEERTKEKFEADAQDKLPVLKEIKTKEIKTDSDKPTHILIEGDNYHALSVLNYRALLCRLDRTIQKWQDRII